MTVCALGHSTRAFDDFVALLDANDITELVDIRSRPGSNYCPQFNQESIIEALPQRIRYTHQVELGGLRKALPVEQSKNQGWRHASFRGYADYMQTMPFRAALLRLIELQQDKNVAIMCTEAVPWRCHRQLVVDALLAEGCTVHHLVGSSKPTQAKMTDFAKPGARTITYPPPKDVQMP